MRWPSPPTWRPRATCSTSRSTCCAAQRRPRREGGLHRRRRHARLRRARRARAPARGRVARAGRQARGARAAADAGRQRLAGELSRRDVRRHRAGGRQHAADGRRLRLHARAFARAGRVRDGRAAADAGGGADQGRPRSAEGDRLASGGAAAPGRGRFRGLPAGAAAIGQARRDARRRPGLLALFVGLDRPTQGHGALARQPVLDRRAVRQGRARSARRRRVLLGRQAVLRLRPGQCADLPAQRRRHRAADGRATDARCDLQALEGRGRWRAAHRLLRRADRLRRHARIAGAAGARRRRAATRVVGRRSAAGRDRRALQAITSACDIVDGIGSTEMLHIFMSNLPAPRALRHHRLAGAGLRDRAARRRRQAGAPTASRATSTSTARRPR